MSLSESYPVQLAIYDLSRGAVQTLSAQFLGPQYHIQAIPHSGVVVFGKEYFFGGGIQCEEPAALRRMMQMLPMQVVNVGRTRVNQAQFDAWCRQKMQTGEFSMESYDLLSHNCNTFSQAALQEGLRLEQGVPQWVLDVPRIFLSSPLGQMVRPMLDNMQLGRVNGAHTVSPTNATRSTSSSTIPLTTAPVPPGNNPWTQIPPPQSTTQNPPRANKSNTKTYPILESHNQPLLANETKTVLMCVQKLIEFAETLDETQSLRTVAQALVENQQPSSTVRDIDVTATAALLDKCLRQGHKLSFALMLLRVVVLHYPESCASTLSWLEEALPTTTATVTATKKAMESPVARTMAWLTLSNVVAKAPTLLMTTPKTMESLVDLAAQDIHPDAQARVEVRQAAAAFLYNTVLAFPPQTRSSSEKDSKKEGELSDTQVSILCGTLESIQTEVDETVRLRRLLAAGRLVRPTKLKHAAAAQLVIDLGLVEGLQGLASSTAAAGGGNLSLQSKKNQSALLAQELLNLLQ